MLSGLANGGIYASVALTLVMIYQATHLVYFARDGDVLNLYRLGDGQCRSTLLDGFRPYASRLWGWRCGRRHRTRCPVAWSALRLEGLYLALATFALAVATPQILKFRGFDLWTGGVQGMFLIALMYLMPKGAIAFSTHSFFALKSSCHTPFEINSSDERIRI